MNAVIIFDISQSATALVRSSMLSRGYYGAWTTGGATYQLPSNTVWKPNTELQQAYNELYQVIAQLNTGRQIEAQIELIRCLTLNSTPWVASLRPVVPIVTPTNG